MKERSITDLKRAQNMMRTTAVPKSSTRLRDDIIRDAWLEISADPPWSVEKFINELSGYANDGLFELIELRKYCPCSLDVILA